MAHWLSDVISHVTRWLSHLTELSVAIFAAGFAAVAGTTGIIVLVYAILSYRNSKTANQIASTAKGLAEQANEMAKRQETRETERHDVHWDGSWDWDHPGRYLLIKRGNDEAHDVRATLTYTSKYNTQEQTATAPRMVADGETLAVDFSKAVLDLNDERYMRQQRAKNPGMAGLYQAVDSTDTRYLRVVGVRVEWVTPLGTPKSFKEAFQALFGGYIRSRR